MTGCEVPVAKRRRLLRWRLNNSGVSKRRRDNSRLGLSASRFATLDPEIEKPQRLICERLALHSSVLFQSEVGNPRTFLLTHSYRLIGVSLESRCPAVTPQMNNVLFGSVK